MTLGPANTHRRHSQVVHLRTLLVKELQCSGLNFHSFLFHKINCFVLDTTTTSRSNIQHFRNSRVVSTNDDDNDWK